MENFIDRVRESEKGVGRGLIGTWVKIPSLETVQLLAHAGFEFVVIDMEHAPHSLERANELVFAAQAMGMAAVVRLADHLGSAIQPLLDGGADGLLVPRVNNLDLAHEITGRMVFAPKGQRGLGLTSRAGKWGLGPIPGYLRRGDEQCLRMVQLEDWASLEVTADYAALEHVNGIFIGHGDLYLSSGKPASDPEVQALTTKMLAATKDAGILSGVAVGTPADAQIALKQGFSLVMVSNDTTLFGKAAAAAVKDTLEGA